MNCDLDSHDSTRARPARNLALWVAGIGLSTLAIWSAWDRGGGYLETQYVTSSGVCLASILVMLVCIGIPDRDWRPTLPVCLAFLVCLGGYLQTIRMPESVVSMISPGSAKAYQDWIPQAIFHEAATPDTSENNGHDSAKIGLSSSIDRIPVSVDAELTQQALAVPLVFACTMWIASLCVTRKGVVVFFFTAMALAGALFSFFGLVDAIRLTRDQSVELRQQLLIAPIGADGPFGPFVNNNNAGSFLILSIACALGAFVFFHERLRCSKAAHRRTDETSPAPPSWVLRPMSLIRQWNSILWMVLIMLVFAGILGSESRGAFLGVISGGVISTVALVGRQINKRSLLLFLGAIVMAVAVLSVTGMISHTLARISTIWDSSAFDDPRLGHWQDSLRAAANYFPAGCGLGAYRYGYLPYQSKGGAAWFLHADGMPIEWILEGGIWLPALTVFAIAVLIRDLARSSAVASQVDSDHANIAKAITVAGIFSLPALLVSQCFDYGILHPPQLITFGFIVGGISRLANQSPRRVEKSTNPRMKTTRRVIATLVVMSLVAGLGVASRITYFRQQTQNAELARKEYLKLSPNQIPQLDKTLDELDALVAKRPYDSSLRRLISQTIMDQQRAIGAQYLTANEITSQKSLQKWVSPRTVRKAYYSENANGGLLQDLMLPGQDVQAWRAARKHAAIALTLCPLDVASRVILIELDMVNGQSGKATPQLLQQSKQLQHNNRQSTQFLNKLESSCDATGSLMQKRKP